MRRLFSFFLAAALTIGAAEAAPSLGAKSHRLGGQSAQQNEPAPLFERALALLGMDLETTVEPVASEERTGRTKARQCDQAKKAQVAKAETREPEGASSKGRSRPTEPVYLAF